MNQCETWCIICDSLTPCSHSDIITFGTLPCYNLFVKQHEEVNPWSLTNSRLYRARYFERRISMKRINFSASGTWLTQKT